MKARFLNAAVAVIVLAALVGNAASTCTGWALVGEVLGWFTIVAALWLVVDNKIKERSAQ